MSKTKKIVSLILSVMLIMTMATVAIVSSSALAEGETYVVAGAGGLCGSEWDPSDTNNLMTWNSEKGIYEKVYTGIAAGTYEFKVINGTAWDNPEFNLEGSANYGGGNASVTVSVDGSTVIVGCDGTKALVEVLAASDDTTAAPEVDTTAAEVDTTAAYESSGDEVTTAAPVVNDDLFKVYFTNSNGWSAVYVHYWGGAAESTWPGEAMTFVEQNGYGQDIYSAVLPEGTTGVVFNGGMDQPQTTDVVPADGMGYYPAEEVDGKWNVGEYQYEEVITTTAAEIITTAPAGDDTTTAPAGDDTTTAPAGDDTTTAPAGDDTTTAPAGDDTTTAPAGDDTTTAAPAGETGIVVDSVVYQAKVGDTVTYTVELTAAELFENIQAYVTYDSDKLELVRKNDNEDLYEEEIACPVLGDAIFNADIEGIVKFNASKVKGYNFKETGVLITLDFIVKDTAQSTIDLVIEEMTIKGDGTESYFTGGEAVITDGITVVETLLVPVDDTTTAPAGDDTTTAPAGDDTTTAPAGDDTTTAPAGDDTTTAPAEDDTTTAPAGDDTTTAPVVTEAPATTAAPTENDNTPNAPSTDPTSGEVEGTTAAGADAPITGAAAYVYVVLAVLAMASCAVVVLRKKVNG